MERTNHADPAPLLSGQPGTVVVSVYTDDESATDPELEPLTPYCPNCHYTQARTQVLSPFSITPSESYHIQ